MTILEAAKEYASRNWHVLPVSRDKKPLLKDWPRRASIDGQQHSKWWSQRFRNAGIGIVCGAKSNLVVIDIDPRNDGVRGLAELERIHGALPTTASVKTGGGGTHLYFKYPNGHTIRSKAGLAGVPGVDVRAEGGYVVAPPSPHVSGGRYECVNGSTDLAELPEDWIALLADDRREAAAVPKGGNPPRRSPAARTIDFIVNGADEGCRNDHLYRAALDMARCGMSRSEATATLLAGCKSCRPPYTDERAIGETISSAFRSASIPPSGAALRSRLHKSKHDQRHAGSKLPWVPFPTELLPEPLMSFVIEGAAAIGCDPAMIALPALSTIASAIGMTRRVRLNRTWAEPAILWCVVVAESGELKSPALDQTRDILREKQELAFTAYRGAAEAHKTDALIFEADLRAWRNKPRDRGDPPKAPAAPVCIRYIADDITTEALALILRDNPRGILLCRDELSGWFASFDTYHATAGGDVARWLELHRGGPLTVDRKTGPERLIYVPCAGVSVTGTIQPATLSRALNRQNFENGLAARLLLSMPPRRKKKWMDRELSEDTAQAFRMMLARLYSLEPARNDEGRVQPVDLPLSTAGKSAWISFYNAFAEEQAATTRDLAKVLSKLEGYAARFALLFQLMRWAAAPSTGSKPEAIDAECVEAGAGLTRWFCHEAERIYGVLGESDDDRNERELVEWIANRGGSVTPRELSHGLRRFRNDAAGARDALEALVTAGRGQWTHKPNSAGGRPTPRFELVTGVTVTETPVHDSATLGFGDGDSGDTVESASLDLPSLSAAGDSGAASTEADSSLMEDIAVSEQLLGERLPVAGAALAERSP